MCLMASPRGHSGSRAVGNTKLKGTTIFPPLTRIVNDSNQQYFTEHGLKIQGDSMDLALCISKGSEKDSPSLARSSSRHMTAKVDGNLNSKVHEEMKEIQTREKQYKNKIHSLQKIVEQLKIDLKGKDEELSAVHQKFQEIEDHYKLLYEEECSTHCQTKNNLTDITKQLEEKCRLMEVLKRKHKESVQEIKYRYEERLAVLKEEHDKKVQERDERIARMKKQMADFLKSNSRERQQQLEELTKELVKVSEEASDLKRTLRSLHKNKQCEKCHLLSTEVSKRQKRILEHEGTINELMSLCQKFETQLMQQAILKECVDMVDKA